MIQNLITTIASHPPIALSLSIKVKIKPIVIPRKNPISDFFLPKAGTLIINPQQIPATTSIQKSDTIITYVFPAIVLVLITTALVKNDVDINIKVKIRNL